MNLYNTQTLRIEPLEPKLEPIKLYACGITPYDTTHLGHAFTSTMVDVRVRYLEFQGQEVRYEQTVTDVDDSCAMGVDALGFLGRIREELSR